MLVFGNEALPSSPLRISSKRRQGTVGWRSRFHGTISGFPAFPAAASMRCGARS